MPLNNKVAISVKRLHGKDISLPCYMTESSAGMDIFAAVNGEETLLPGERKLIPTGIAIALSPGYEAQIRPRSGLAVEAGITVLNSPGTIDADYRGEVKILIINHGDKPFAVKRGDRIAQMVIHKIYRASWNMTDNLEITKRGDGGFGHTG
ncbi:MAG: dUTP diphosphatase [Deltaproteobacteria bacterium]|nr:dUTP diphosphatase [Deltaproteobacteria bacterium]MBW2648636.1 dUTP diphosphatase [Deltaproteobacteria bacterium]